ncbi:DUF3450 domain-containing protein [Halomonas halocynthiae]|uniref:DUF3450 domain-containing protein n=1 Tax=Halomonas halocynthiae TaxID=176290 RepID=UPI001F0B39C8|nr:DUF3450 domain-containing protein [Halomonas halocynthiae]
MQDKFVWSRCWRPAPLGGLLTGLLASVVMSQALAASVEATVTGDALDAQRTQAALQRRIDTADDEVRANIEALRKAQHELRRLSAYNAELAPQVERETQRLDQRLAALDGLALTRDALPGTLRNLVERFRLWVESDIPFLHKERLARADSLEVLLGDASLSAAEKLERVLSAWRSELAYGQELDSWRGELSETQDQPARDVEFLRVGRVGWYYLTPDGNSGGVWKSEPGHWEALDSQGVAELRKGVSMVREQRAPGLLALPLSQSQPRLLSKEHDS